MQIFLRKGRNEIIFRKNQRFFKEFFKKGLQNAK